MRGSSFIPIITRKGQISPEFSLCISRRAVFTAEGEDVAHNPALHTFT